VINPVALYLALCLAVAYGLLLLHGWCWWRERRRRQGPAAGRCGGAAAGAAFRAGGGGQEQGANPMSCSRT
jgi:hypothetical protein